MRFHEQLEQLKSVFTAKVPAEAQAAILGHIQEQSGIAWGLREGDSAPKFTLNNPLGQPVTLHDELAQGPVVLVFYRGGWCPYCNLQLRVYEEALPEIRNLGGRLMAISPESSDRTLSMEEQEKLTFPVLSDPDGRVADLYRLRFELPACLQSVLKNTLRLDLAEINETGRWVLPVPAVYVIDREGTIRRSHADPDFMKRMEPQEIIDALKRI
ncbi:peroxiredoxin [Paenibacillus mucilaginosus]|uniref:peroxiredoxin-like family protein n=1 Tax=Paenibacillus mucilaginosus TaxID=61624 RepID=UPI003D24BC1C